MSEIKFIINSLYALVEAGEALSGDELKGLARVLERVVLEEAKVC